jgi:hypothetical protein
MQLVFCKMAHDDEEERVARQRVDELDAMQAVGETKSDRKRAAKLPGPD